jgi:hypothetical protein
MPFAYFRKYHVGSGIYNAAQGLFNGAAVRQIGGNPAWEITQRGNQFLPEIGVVNKNSDRKWVHHFTPGIVVRGS